MLCDEVSEPSSIVVCSSCDEKLHPMLSSEVSEPSSIVQFASQNTDINVAPFTEASGRMYYWPSGSERQSDAVDTVTSTSASPQEQRHCRLDRLLVGAHGVVSEHLRWHIRLPRARWLR